MKIVLNVKDQMLMIVSDVLIIKLSSQVMISQGQQCVDVSLPWLSSSLSHARLVLKNAQLAMDLMKTNVFNVIIIWHCNYQF